MNNSKIHQWMISVLKQYKKSFATKASQKPKSKDHLLTLEHRLELWKEGKLDDLFTEGETIQTSLKAIKKPCSTAEII